MAEYGRRRKRFRDELDLIHAMDDDDPEFREFQDELEQDEDRRLPSPARAPEFEARITNSFRWAQTIEILIDCAFGFPVDPTTIPLLYIRFL